MLTFKCKSCNHLFEAVGIKEERMDPIYGPCFKYVADCPLCNKKTDEYRVPQNKKQTQQTGCGMSGGCGSCSMR